MAASIPPVTLARAGDAEEIAVMSRLLVEDGLDWRWRQRRILACIRDPQHNVAIARQAGSIAGFGIMSYGPSDAHLLLFAVRPEWRRRKLGSRLLRWLEETAMVAGIEAIHLEVRHTNRPGRQFYHAHGYRERGVVPGYYDGREAAVRMVRRLRPTVPQLAGRFTGVTPKPPR